MATEAARLKRKEPTGGEKRKTGLTLTGLLMEELGFPPLPQTQLAESDRLRSASIIGRF